jgi:hypothetical protein
LFQMFSGGIASMLFFHDVVFFGVVVCSILFCFKEFRQATVGGLLEKSSCCLLLFTGKVVSNRSNRSIQTMARHRSLTSDCWEFARSVCELK